MELLAIGCLVLSVAAQPAVAAQRGEARRLVQEALAEKDHAKAIALYTRAIEADPKLEIAFVKRGSLLQEEKRFAEAIPDFTRAIELGVRTEWVLASRAFCRLNTDDPKGAVEDFTKGIAIGPELGMDYYHRHRAKKMLGDDAGAAADLAKAIAINPEVAEAANEAADVDAEARKKVQLRIGILGLCAVGVGLVLLRPLGRKRR